VGLLIKTLEKRANDLFALNPAGRGSSHPIGVHPSVDLLHPAGAQLVAFIQEIAGCLSGPVRDIHGRPGRGHDRRPMGAGFVVQSRRGNVLLPPRTCHSGFDEFHCVPAPVVVIRLLVSARIDIIRGSTNFFKVFR
jgi:hypothetical protein